MYVKIKLTDEPSWPMCILDLSKQPAKGTAQNTERLNVNGAACMLVDKSKIRVNSTHNFDVKVCVREEKGRHVAVFSLVCWLGSCPFTRLETSHDVST